LTAAAGPVVVVAGERPLGHRVVPLLGEHDLGHYPEFREFLATTFGLADDPLGAPGLLRVDDRPYELVFIGRSGRPFPAGVEIGALVPGLEPLDEAVADRDLWASCTGSSRESTGTGAARRSPRPAASTASRPPTPEPETAAGAQLVARWGY
jgi:hypothetical protein